LLSNLLLSFKLFDEFPLLNLIRTENPLIFNFNFKCVFIFLVMKILNQNFLKENVLKLLKRYIDHLLVNLNLLCVLSCVDFYQELIRKGIYVHFNFHFILETVLIMRLFNRIVTGDKVILILLTFDWVLQKLILFVTWKLCHFNIFNI